MDITNSILQDKFQFESVKPISTNAFKDYFGIEVKLVPAQEGEEIKTNEPSKQAFALT